MKLQNYLLSSNNLYFLVVQLICTVVWFLPFCIGTNANNDVSIGILSNNFTVKMPALLASILQYCYITAVGLIINVKLQRTKFISVHNKSFYYIFISLFAVTHYAQHFNTESISFLILLLAIYQLLKMYQSESPFLAFNSTFLLTISAFFNFEYLWFIPFFWLLFIQLKAFTSKTFLASLFGITTVVLAVFLLAYINNTLPLIINYIETNSKITLFDIEQLQISTIDQIFGSIFFIYLVFYIVISYLIKKEQSNIFRTYYTFSVLLLLFTFIIYLANNSFLKIYQPLLFLMAFFSTFYYNFEKNKMSNYLLIGFLIVGLSYRITYLINLA